ncbi:MAG: hypothetical protein U1G07_04785 [Verrucomicrobiota bacterium]
MPLLLLLFRWLSLRHNDAAPSWTEMTWILIVWSVLFEWIGPHLVARATGDWVDVLMYWTGGILAWAIWQRRGREPTVA